MTVGNIRIRCGIHAGICAVTAGACRHPAHLHCGFLIFNFCYNANLAHIVFKSFCQPHRGGSFTAVGGTSARSRALVTREDL